jgi:hypothetical protein
MGDLEICSVLNGITCRHMIRTDSSANCYPLRSPHADPRRPYEKQILPLLLVIITRFSILIRYTVLRRISRRTYCVFQVYNKNYN